MSEKWSESGMDESCGLSECNSGAASRVSSHSLTSRQGGGGVGGAFFPPSNSFFVIPQIF